MKQNYCILLIGAILTLPAYAGFGAHGGNAVLCYKSVTTRDAVAKELQDPSMRVEVDLKLEELERTPELLDLVEASLPRGLNSIQDVPILGYSASDVWQKLSIEAKDFYKLSVLLKTSENEWASATNGVLELSDATIQQRLPRNCLVSQIARYDDTTSTIFYDRRIYLLMTKIHREALKMHEDIFKFYRAQWNKRQQAVNVYISYFDKNSIYIDERTLSTGETAHDYYFSLYLDKNSQVNSDTTRALVGYLFTNSKYEDEKFEVFARNIAVGIQFKFSYGLYQMTWDYKNPPYKKP